MDMSVNASALNAFGSGMQVIGHNIANVSTRDFEPQTYSYMSGPGDMGVQIVPPRGETQNTSWPSCPDAPVGIEAECLNNSVDLARETVHLITTQRAYEANAHTISAIEDTNGVLLDMVV